MAIPFDQVSLPLSLLPIFFIRSSVSFVKPLFQIFLVPKPAREAREAHAFQQYF